ncbi:glycosyltransferase family 2 protein [Halobaculum rarum]|uniref:glycosyltransferase family 2 protein n=1 Tax=Halobaculum rarum TaxID=3075122 RepID=UPI0032AF6ADD
MSSKLEISACITTKDNEDTIGECLSSIGDFVDEIIVVDSFSEDSTIEICRNYGAKVIEKEFTGIADMKRTAIENANNEWVFIIDSDEVIPPKLKHEIIENFDPNNFVAYYIWKKNYMFDSWIRASHPERPLLAKKSVIYFEEDYVMEELSVEDQYRNDTAHLSNPIHHYIYSNSYEYIMKHNQYSSLEALRLHDSNQMHSVFYHFALGIGTCCYYLFISRSLFDGWEGIFWSGMHIWFQLLVYQKSKDLRKLKTENPEDWRTEWLEQCKR